MLVLVTASYINVYLVEGQIKAEIKIKIYVYFAGILVALAWFRPTWVWRYELSYVHMRYLPFNRVASWVYWDYRRDAVTTAPTESN
jgi:hypothetical protein